MTAKYIDTVLTRLTVVGSAYILVVCLFPEILRSFVSSIPFYFGGTSLLITVVVVMDFMAQLQAHMTSNQSERSEEHTSELQSLMRISYAVFCLTKKKQKIDNHLNTRN